MSNDALAGTHARDTHDVLCETGRARDHEVGGPILPQQQRAAFTTDQLRRDAEDRVEQILRSTIPDDLRHGLPLPARPTAGSTSLLPSLLLFGGVWPRIKGATRLCYRFALRPIPPFRSDVPDLFDARSS